MAQYRLRAREAEVRAITISDIPRYPGSGGARPCRHGNWCKSITFVFWL